MTNAFKRVLKFQKHVLKSIRADVRRVIGPQDKAILGYYRSYKREFNSSAKLSNKEELIQNCLNADIILLGDYHTFKPSQSTAKEIISNLIENQCDLVIGLEMIQSNKQNELNDYLNKEISEDEFLKKIQYEKSWGFAWDSFKRLLDIAQQHHLKVLALNIDHKSLEARDLHAAKIIAQSLQQNPSAKLFVLYGDLHLARTHLPKKIQLELAQRLLNKKILTIFQNSESLYWKLAKDHIIDSVDVLRLSRNRYCIMNAAPWVKLQSFLDWAEQQEQVEPIVANDTLQEKSETLLKHLCTTLTLQPIEPTYTIKTIDDISFINQREFTNLINRAELKIIKYNILNNKNFYIPKLNILYLASSSINAVAEGVTSFLYFKINQLDQIYADLDAHFYSNLLLQTMAYLGSKLLNHKRKCDLESDYQTLLNQKLSRRPLAQEKIKRKAAWLILKNLTAQKKFLKTKRYQRITISQHPAKYSIYIEVIRGLGAILGEQLYLGYVSGQMQESKIQMLFQTPLIDDELAKQLYLALLQDLSQVATPIQSKKEIF